MELDDLPPAGQELVHEATHANDADALAAWQRVAQAYPRFLAGRLNYASALLHAHGPSAAREQCERLEHELGPRLEITAQRALIELADGRASEALALADQALQGGYPWPPLLAARADALLRLGRVEQAEEAFLEAYRREPHAWSTLQRYCELTERAYVSPHDDAPSPVGPVERLWLYAYVDRVAHTPDDEGRAPGCNHTLRFVDAWCDRVDEDPVALYQFLNARGGFCDCEVIFNVEPSDASYERVAIAGTLQGDDEIVAAMLDSGVLRVSAEPPSQDEESEDEASPVVVARQPGGLSVWPQRVPGRSLGMLLDLATVLAGHGASATLVVFAPDDDGAQHLWNHGPDGYAVRPPTEAPPEIAAEVAFLLDALQALADR